MENFINVKATRTIWDETDKNYDLFVAENNYKFKVLENEREVIEDIIYEIDGRALYFPETEHGWFLLYMEEDETIEYALSKYDLIIL